MQALEQKLVDALARPLPGPEAQLRMAPRPRHGWRPGAWPEDARHGGGLLLLYPRRARPHVVLTLRDSRLPQHAGQVSLPGGAAKRGESWRESALREAQEEVGLDPAAVRVLGELSPIHVPVSGFVIHPCLAVAHEEPEFVADPREVARILEVPLVDLRDPALRGRESRERGDRSAEIPYFSFDGERVWGATAMILAELLALLGEGGPRP